MTLEEVAASFSEDLPEWQREANLSWLKNVHRTLKEGGTWASPNLERIFTKRGDGFEEVLK